MAVVPKGYWLCGTCGIDNPIECSRCTCCGALFKKRVKEDKPGTADGPQSFKDVSPPLPKYADYGIQADAVCKVLCREIANAKRWSAIVDAWQAILTVRRMEKELRAEQEYLNPASTPRVKESN